MLKVSFPPWRIGSLRPPQIRDHLKMYFGERSLRLGDMYLTSMDNVRKYFYKNI